MLYNAKLACGGSNPGKALFSERNIISTIIDFLGRYLYLLGVALGAAAFAYSLLALVAMLRRPRAAPLAGPVAAPVTILKPLCGSEARLYEALHSFCVLDYPRYQIIFGVADRHDPAVHVVETLRREFPQLDLSLVVCGARHGSNPKVSNLINMMQSARHDNLVIADSDILVAPDYLQRLVPHLEDPGVGIVTCAYRGQPVSGVWSSMGAEFINGWFTPSVFVSAFLRSRAFAFGATIALTRQVLESVGGFAAIADQLADDYRLGQLTRGLRLRTVLSEVIVDTTVSEPALPELVDHQLRWLRTIRCVRPVGYALAGFTLSVPVALLGTLVSLGQAGTPWLLLLTIACRALLFYIGPSPGRRGLRGLPMALAADCALFTLWCASFTSQRVRWREADFEVSDDGSVVAVMETVDHAMSSGELL
jgi:ceramide glucosyltransferase